MTYQLELMRDNPIGVWIHGASGTANDFCGRRSDFTTSGTTSTYLPLFNGTDWSLILNESAEAKFQYGSRYRNAYTIEAMVSIVSPGESVILGHKDSGDGLTLSGTTVKFSTRFESGGVTEASFDLQYAQNFHVAGVYDGGKNSLFVNGTLVAESDVSVEEYLDGPDTEEDSFYSIGGSGRVSIAGIAIYHHALTRASINRHYLAAIQSLTNEEVSARFNGYRVPLWQSELVKISEYDWSGDSITDAIMSGFVVEDGYLVPETSLGLTTGSVWKSSVMIDTDISRPVSLVLFAETNGIDVEYSTDGAVWTTIDRVAKQTVTDTDPVLVEIRAVVQAGLEPDGITIASIGAHVLESDLIDDGTRQVINSGTVINQEDSQQNRLYEADGASLRPGNIVIETGNHPTRTIEIFARNMSSSSQTFLDLRVIGQTTLPRISSTATLYSAVGTVYINGQPYSGAFTWPVGEWRLVHIVLPSDLATDIVIGKAYDSSSNGQFQIGNVVLYPDSLGASEIEDIFALNFGSKSFRLSQAGTIIVSEPAESVTPYSYDWSIQAAG